MRTVKTVAGSSANLMELNTVAFDAAPLKIITAQREFVDDRNPDLNEMLAFFKSYKTILKHLKESGLKTGKVIPAHCLNESAANTLKSMIGTYLPGVTVKIDKNLGLCSFYAEKGGLLAGFERY